MDEIIIFLFVVATVFIFIVSLVLRVGKEANKHDYHSSGTKKQSSQNTTATRKTRISSFTTKLGEGRKIIIEDPVYTYTVKVGTNLFFVKNLQKKNFRVFIENTSKELANFSFSGADSFLMDMYSHPTKYIGIVTMCLGHVIQFAIRKREEFDESITTNSSLDKNEPQKVVKQNVVQQTQTIQETPKFENSPSVEINEVPKVEVPNQVNVELPVINEIEIPQIDPIQLDTFGMSSLNLDFASLNNEEENPFASDDIKASFQVNPFEDKKEDKKEESININSSDKVLAFYQSLSEEDKTVVRDMTNSFFPHQDIIIACMKNHLEEKEYIESINNSSQTMIGKPLLIGTGIDMVMDEDIKNRLKEVI